MTTTFSMTGMALAELAKLAGRWGSVYNAHATLQATIAFAHIGGLLVGGGLAIASDRVTVRSLRQGEDDRRRALAHLHGVHRPVLASLAVIVASGALLFAADLKTFATSPLYWAKMALVAVLLVNGARLARIERRLLSRSDADDEAGAVGLRDWQRLRTIAVASIALWLATTFAGTLLVNIAS